jgi:hypothetical protein
MATPELDARLAFANAVCDPAVQRDAAGQARVGCAKCVDATLVAGAPRAPVAFDPATFYPLHTLVRGSFTRARADEVAASLDGCEPHSSNFGGTVFAEANGASWAHARYVSAVNPSECIPYRRADGRDILVCRALDAHQGHGTDSVFAFDLARVVDDDVEKGWLPVVSMSDDAFAGCTFGGASNEPVSSGAVESFTLHDEDGDGKLELVVVVSQRRGKPTAAYRALCDKALAGAEGMDAEVRAALGQAHRYRLVFGYDGAAFVPTAATRGLLRKL